MNTKDQPFAGYLDGREHVLPVRVYYEDTDFTGVVYHGNYVRYFERGRSDFLRVVGVSHAALLGREDQAAFTVVRMEIDFRKPARIDDGLTVRSSCNRAKGPRLYFDQKIMRGEDLLAQAVVEVACIDMSGRPRKPPAGLMETLRPLFC